MAAVARGEKLALVCLKLARGQLAESIGFYTGTLQFQLLSDGPVVRTEESADGPPCRVARQRLALTQASPSFALNSAGIELVSLVGADGGDGGGSEGGDSVADFTPYEPPRDDVFWKIGLALHDLDASVTRLATLGAPGCAEVQGRQFLDIGYLVHVTDPAGFTVELLQTTFEGSAARRAALAAASRGGAWEASPLAQDNDVVMGQITTRITNEAASLEFYQQVLGMKLLAEEPVPDYNFRLFFLAYTDEEPPNAEDLEAVENREWLYQRPYTTLELQLVASGPLRSVGPKEGGLEGIVVQLAECSPVRQRLKGRLKSIGGREFLEDPDGLRIFVEKL